jgi:hypothetical protein
MSAAGVRERDPHFRQILEGLAGHLHPQLFEECVTDLLRDAFPSLVAVHGGSDAGMDGAIADGAGEAFPLIVTTSGRVLRNLTESWHSYLALGGTRSRTVMATSSALSPAKRRNLHERARELGFLLVQIFDRRDLASRLYRDSKWTKLLLGITGEPPALSAVPRTRRPLVEGIEAVGRGADFGWLRESSGDRLVVGEPGSGKTFLLLQLVREGKALFLASEDEGRFADAYRDQRPELVLVDDAHLAPERLDRLRQIRQDIHGGFAIVAASWKGSWKEVADALGGLPAERVRHLELLTRQEIVEVLRRIGVQEPEDDPYLAELVDQASYRPGLAVTLGSLWLRGDYREVLTGQAILRSLVPALCRVMEQDPSQLLAGFALGGKRGMGLSAVAGFLESGVGEVWERTAQVGSSGLLAERGKDAAGEAVLAVEPATLRAALLHKVFFSPGGRAWKPLLQQAPSRPSGVETLVTAAQRGVPVPRDELRELLLRGGSPTAWGGFALLGEGEGAWVLDHYPGATADVARETLSTAPRQVVQRLLEHAEKTESPAAALGSQPLGILRTWIEDIPGEPDWVAESLRRRRHLVDKALDQLQGGGEPAVALRAAFLALSPRLERSRPSATGNSLVLRQGSLPASAVPEMLPIWQRIRSAVRDLDPASWQELSNALHWWIHPNLPRAALGEDGLRQFHQMAGRILADLVPFTRNRPGLAAALLERAGQVGLRLDLSADPVFETLYPSFLGVSLAEGPEPVQQALREAEESARRLARSWARRPPDEVIDDLARYAAETKWGHSSLGTIAEFEESLALGADEPDRWVRILLEKKGGPSLLSAFLHRVVEERRPDWKALLERCLRTGNYAWAASTRVLRLPEPPDDLLEFAVARAEPQLVEGACLQGKVATETLRRLLSDRDPRIALAAAIGEWLAEPRESVRPEVRAEWRNVVVGAKVRDLESRPHEGYWLQAILSLDPELAFDWLQAQLALEAQEQPVPASAHGLIPAAIRALAPPQRARLLAELGPDSFSVSLLRHLIGDSRLLFRKLLGRRELRSVHLAPLAGKPPDSRWASLARLALEAGHQPHEIAAVSFDFIDVFTPSVEHYSRWETGFRRLTKSEHPGLREAGGYGLRHAGRLIEEARGRERRFQVGGRS